MAQYDTEIRWSESDFNDELARIWKEAIIVCYVSTKVSTHVQTPRLTQQLPSGRCGTIWNTVYIRSTTYSYVYKKGVQLKFKLQHPGTSSTVAWSPHHLCYRPTVPFRHLRLCALSSLHGKILRMFKHVITTLSFFFEYYVPCNCAKVTVWGADSKVTKLRAEDYETVVRFPSGRKYFLFSNMPRVDLWSNQPPSLMDTEGSS